jgi:hypothetical protein
VLSASIGTCFLVHYKDTVLTLFYQITFAQILLQWSIFVYSLVAMEFSWVKNGYFFHHDNPSQQVL